MIAQRSSFRVIEPGLAILLDEYANTIDKAVDFGLHLLEMLPERLNARDLDTPIFMSLMHILDLLDSVAVLVRQASIDPCTLILRGVLESYLGLAYIFEYSQQQRQRATAFLVHYYHQRIKKHQLGDATSNVRRELEKSLKDDAILAGVPIGIDPSVQVRVNRLLKLLQQPLYANAEVEYQRKKHTNWYSMYDGPANLEQLADHLKMAAFYELHYRSWSSVMHGTDIIAGKITSIEEQSGVAGIVQLRRTDEVHSVVNHALTFALRLLRLVVESVLPHRLTELQDFYISEIRTIYWKSMGNEPSDLPDNKWFS